MLKQLAVPVKVTMWRLDGSMRLNYQEARIRAIFAHFETIGCAAGDDDVVALMIREKAKIGFNYALPVVDKVDLVTFAIAIKVVHAERRSNYGQGNVLVEHQWLTSKNGVTARRQGRGLEMMVTLHIHVPFFKMYIPEFLNPFHPCGRVMVVDVGIIA